MAERKGRRSDRKTTREARVERITWGLMVLVFAVLRILPDGVAAELPIFSVPMAGAFILFGSGAFQYSRKWRVAPPTWIGGTFCALMVVYNVWLDGTRDFIGATLVVFIGILVFGILANEA